MRLDQAESVFRHAAKTRFEFEELSFGKILLVTDLLPERTQALLERVKEFLDTVDRETRTEWLTIDGDAYGSVKELVSRITALEPDLLVTYRGLKDTDKDPVYSLGTYLDVLSQVIPVPVLVLPGDAEGPLAVRPESLKQVMVVTDHLTGDSRLVNAGVAFVRHTGGELFLAHVEDDQVYARYMEVIGKLPSIETETAREDIKKQLLIEPHEFIESCRQGLEKAGLSGIEIRAVVHLGHRMRDYVALVKAHGVDLLVFNTKDESQLAMHGIAYSLAVELRHIPLLLL